MRHAYSAPSSVQLGLTAVAQPTWRSGASTCSAAYAHSASVVRRCRRPQLRARSLAATVLAVAALVAEAAPVETVVTWRARRRAGDRERPPLSLQVAVASAMAELAASAAASAAGS
eukprot:scaffold1428_cov64-Phaeocystis_antarctica.AAC.1